MYILTAVYFYSLVKIHLVPAVNCFICELNQIMPQLVNAKVKPWLTSYGVLTYAVS